MGLVFLILGFNGSVCWGTLQDWLFCNGSGKAEALKPKPDNLSGYKGFHVAGLNVRVCRVSGFSHRSPKLD